MMRATLCTSTHCSIFGKKKKKKGSSCCTITTSNLRTKTATTQQYITTTKGTVFTQNQFTSSSCVQEFNTKLKQSKALILSYSPSHAWQPLRVCSHACIGFAVKLDMCLWSWTHQRGTACAPAGCCRTGTGCHRHHKCRVLKNHKAHRSIDSLSEEKMNTSVHLLASIIQEHGWLSSSGSRLS